MRRIVLASASPRRRELLAVFGFDFEVLIPSVDETPFEGESPPDYALRTAEDKGRNVSSRVPTAIVLSADTVVSIDQRILGKPGRDASTARAMLRALSGRVHSVYTAVVVIDSLKDALFREVDETRVWFRDLDDSEIGDYIRTEDVTDKAGAYAIQGSAGGFIPRIQGNYSNVVGLPLPITYALLERASGLIR